MNYFIIDQTNPHTGEFDEHKLVEPLNDTIELNIVDAALVYLSNYEPNWQGLGAISEVTPHIFDLWLKHGNRKAPFSNSDFAEKPLHLALVGDAAPDPSKSRHWITTETGSHILINGNGEVLAGAGGKLAGKKFSVPAGSKDVSKHIETVEKIAKAGYEKHGGDKAEYLRMGRNKGSSSYFAREYEKKGIDALPEGHLREALVDKPADNAAANGGQSRASTDTNLLKTAFKKTLEDPLSNNKVFEAYKSMKGVRYNTEQWKKMREQSIEKMEKAENDYFNIDNVLDEHYKKMQKLGVTDYAKNSRKANELEEKKRKIEDDWLNALGGLALSTERLTNRKPTQKEIAQAIDRKNQEDNPALSGLKALAEEYGEKSAGNATNRNPNNLIKVGNFWTKSGRESEKAGAHQMTLEQYREHIGTPKNGTVEEIHKAAIKRALESGKDVHPDILAEYPELKESDFSSHKEAALEVQRQAEEVKRQEQIAKEKADATKNKAAATKQANAEKLISSIEMPKGYMTEIKDGKIVVSGAFTDKMHEDLKEMGFKWDGQRGNNTKTWIAPLTAAKRLHAEYSSEIPPISQQQTATTLTDKPVEQPQSIISKSENDNLKSLMINNGAKLTQSYGVWRIGSERISEEQAEFFKAYQNSDEFKREYQAAKELKEAKQQEKYAKQPKLLSGDTYAIRNELKERFKAKWNGYGWEVPPEKYEEAQAFINSKTTQKPETTKPSKKKMYTWNTSPEEAAAAGVDWFDLPS